MLTRRSSIRWRPAVLVLAACFVAPSFGGEGLRRLHVGDTMPEFTLAGAKGTTFDYRHEQARVLGVVILQAGQNHLDRLVTDIEALTQQLKSEATAFDCVGVMSGPGAGEYLRSRVASVQAAFPVLADPDFVFWGKLGVIAAPTAVVVGADHRLQWVKAGYGYDFVAGFHAQLNRALGLDDGAEASVRVETLENTSLRARRDRHIQLARTLAKKGRFDAAIKELEGLRRLDPNAVDAALELGEVLCRAGQNEAALKAVAAVTAATKQDKAHALLVRAWARRQMGELDAAASLLSTALDLAPESPRILYELGKVHQAKGDAEKALACYRKALAEVFGDTDSAGASQK